jgi:ABC-2 type transport system permease protein
MTARIRSVGAVWWLHLKMRSRSSFEGVLELMWPLFFATTIFMIYRNEADGRSALLSAVVGSAMMGVWSATSTSSAFALQMARGQGMLELFVAAPTPFPLVIMPITLSMATIGIYSVLVTLLWGHFVFNVELVIANVPMFVVSVLVTVLAIGMMGFLLAICSVRYRQAWALGNALTMPIWLLCGFLISVSILPPWIRPLSWLLAPTWGMSAIRAAAEGRDALPALGACFALAVAYGFAGILLSKLLVDSARSRATLALS